MTNTIETPVESPLEERQLVWCLESYIPGRLCTIVKHYLRQNFIVVFRTEEDALDHIRNGNWVYSHTGVLPIQLSLESVIQHSLEQGPSRTFGYPCVGYVWMPENEKIYTSELVEKGRKQP